MKNSINIYLILSAVFFSSICCAGILPFYDYWGSLPYASYPGNTTDTILFLQNSSVRKKNNTDFVHTQGDEVISGNKTFSTGITAPNVLSPTGNGSGLTQLNASALISGTVPDARLSANVVMTTDGRLQGFSINGQPGFTNLSTAKVSIGSTPATLTYSTNQLVNTLTIPKNIELKQINGAIITVASGQNLSFQRQPQLSNGQAFTGTGTVTGLRESHPEWFGAVGDESTDDTVAVQAAADAGTHLKLSRKHAITKLILRQNNLVVSGDTPDACINCTDGTGATFTCVNIVENYTGITLKNFTIKGRATTEPAGPNPVRGIVVGTNAAGTAHSALTYDAYAVIDGVHITGNTPGTNGFNLGVQMNMAGKSKLINSTIDSLYGIHSSYGYGAVVNGIGQTVLNNLFNSTISGQGRHAVYLTNNPSDVTVDNNTAYNFQSEGITSSNAGASTDRNISITNNKLINCLASDGSANAAVIGVQGIKNAKVLGNTIIGSIGIGIRVSYSGSFLGADNTTVANNSLLNIGANGILLSNSNYVNIHDNTINGISLNSAGVSGGIEIISSNNGQVHHNTMTSGTAYRFGVRLNASAPVPTNMRVTDNPLSGTYTTAFENSGIGTGNQTNTWTPALNFSVSNGTLAATFGNATYYVSGNRVYVETQLTITSMGTASGNVTITGLPLPANSAIPTIIMPFYGSAGTSTLASIGAGGSVLTLLVNPSTVATQASLAAGSYYIKFDYPI